MPCGKAPSVPSKTCFQMGRLPLPFGSGFDQEERDLPEDNGAPLDANAAMTIINGSPAEHGRRE